ncbi:MAG: His/Gly/Thr/Pro-type tRNA ligase C-terminal domain-containing protein, partial [Candidatus Thiodiazotropha sp.]
LLEATDLEQRLPGVDLFMIMMSEEAKRRGMQLAESLRDELPALRLICHCGDGGFKSQFKKADKSSARYALVLGDDELSRGEAGLKPLREKGEQRQVALEELAATLATLL